MLCDKFLLSRGYTFKPTNSKLINHQLTSIAYRQLLFFGWIQFCKFLAELNLRKNLNPELRQHLTRLHCFRWSQFNLSISIWVKTLINFIYKLNTHYSLTELCLRPKLLPAHNRQKNPRWFHSQQPLRIFLTTVKNQSDSRPGSQVSFPCCQYCLRFCCPRIPMHHKRCVRFRRQTLDWQRVQNGCRAVCKLFHNSILSLGNCKKNAGVIHLNVNSTCVAVIVKWFV